MANSEHRVFPYLLRGLDISRADHVWCADITYVPVTQGLFLSRGRDGLGNPARAHLADVEHYGRVVLRQGPGRSVGPGDSGDFQYRQGARFTSEAFADRVLAADVRFSMDGRGRFLDNIFIERLWRSLKYEAVYLHELRDGVEAGRVIGSWIYFYNEVRPHSPLGGQTPGEAYREGAEVT